MAAGKAPCPAGNSFHIPLPGSGGQKKIPARCLNRAGTGFGQNVDAFMGKPAVQRTPEILLQISHLLYFGYFPSGQGTILVYFMVFFVVAERAFADEPLQVGFQHDLLFQ